MPRLPWNKELETALLYCVLANKAHICSGKKVSQTWNIVNDMFYEQELLASHKERHYKKDKHRKLRDKYELLIESLRKAFDAGEFAGKQDDLDDLHKYAKRILIDISGRRPAKDSWIEDDEKVIDAAKSALGSSGTLKRKQSEMERTDDFGRDLMSLLPPPTTPPPSGQHAMKRLHPAEEEFEVQFLKWIGDNNKTLQNLLLTSKISVSMYEGEMEEIGLKTLVSIYCTRGENFSAKIFKGELREMELPMLVCSKLYSGLQDWRREYEQTSNQGKTTDLSNAIKLSGVV